MSRSKVAPMLALWALDYDDLLDRVLEGEIAPMALIEAAFSADARAEQIGRRLYGLLRAKSRQLLKTAQAEADLNAWSQALVRSEAWLRQKRQSEIAQKLTALVDLLEDEATLLLQRPAEAMLAHVHVRELVSFVRAHGGEVARAQLGARLKISQPNLTRLLNLVEAAQLIGRKRLGKQKRVFLTERGRKLAQNLPAPIAVVAAHKTLPAWTRDLKVEIPTLMLNADTPRGAIDAQLLYAQSRGLGKKLGVEIIHDKQSRVHEHNGFAGRISLNLEERPPKNSMDVAVTHAVQTPLVLDTGPAADWSHYDAENVLQRVRAQLRDNPHLTIVLDARDAKRFLGERRGEMLEGVEFKTVKGAKVERYVSAMYEGLRESSGIEIILCHEPRIANTFRSSWSEDFVLTARPDKTPKLTALPKFQARRSCLATLEVDISPDTWMRNARELDAVSRFYRLGDLLARTMPDEIDEYLKFLRALAKRPGVLGDSIVRSLASTTEADLREVLRKSYQWWGLGQDSERNLAGDVFSKLASGASEKFGTAAAKQATVVRAHEESQIGAMWRKHESLCQRAEEKGLRQDFEGWFDENAREAADQGLWFGVTAAMAEAEHRMFGA